MHTVFSIGVWLAFLHVGSSCAACFSIYWYISPSFPSCLSLVSPSSPTRLLLVSYSSPPRLPSCLDLVFIIAFYSVYTTDSRALLTALLLCMLSLVCYTISFSLCSFPPLSSLLLASSLFLAFIINLKPLSCSIEHGLLYCVWPSPLRMALFVIHSVLLCSLLPPT